MALEGAGVYVPGAPLLLSPLLLLFHSLASHAGESMKATTYRLKWNWFFVIALSLLVSNGASSPMGTLHEFVTNPTSSGASGQEVS